MEVLLCEERWVSSHSHVCVYGSQIMMQLGWRVDMVAARAVVTAQRMACICRDSLLYKGSENDDGFEW